MKFSHVKGKDLVWGPDPLADEERQREFFEYADLGIMAATNGLVNAQLVRAKTPPEGGTGWHTHQLDFHIVYVVKGWARFMYNNQVTYVEAGDCIHQLPGIVHYLFDYSPDMEYLEICSPGNFGTKHAPAPEGAEVPPSHKWE